MRLDVLGDVWEKRGNYTSAEIWRYCSVRARDDLYNSGFYLPRYCLVMSTTSTPRHARSSYNCVNSLGPPLQAGERGYTPAAALKLETGEYSCDSSGE